MNDVTSKIKIIPSPFNTSANYAQNVWDLQLFNNKIYIGQGNSSNILIDCNAGPIPVHSLDPATDTITKEFIVDEEQINIFRVLNGKLVIPGHDSKEGWELGNYYTNDGSVWKKFRNIPRGVHVLDMLYCKGVMFASLGTDGLNSPLVISKDNGITWTPALTVTSSSYQKRYYNLFEFKGEVYAIHILNNKVGASSVYELKKFNGSQFVTYAAAYNMIPPKYLMSSVYRVSRVVNAMDKLLYIVGMEFNDLQVIESKAFVSSSLGTSTADQATMITFPDNRTIPTDFLVRQDKVYVLSYIKNAPKNYTVMVYETTDLSTWTEKFRFNSDAFGRSIEEANGSFYIGLGSYTDYDSVNKVYIVPESVGSIVKVTI
jgi:hypothetical protein